MPKLSVIIPIYNVEKYLRQCLDSVVNQTFFDIEIILVDDGSPDNCGLICDEYAKKDNRIVVIHKKNEGLSFARNDAIKIASGKYVAFVDSDDWLDLDIYERVMKYVYLYDADITMFNAYRNVNDVETNLSLFKDDFVTNNKEVIRGFQAGTLVKFATETKELVYGYPWDRIFKRSFIKDNNLLFSDVKAYEDVIYAINSFQYADKVAFVSERGYHYRYNPKSIGNRYMPDRINVDREVYDELFRLGRTYNVNQQYYDALNALICFGLVNLLDRCIFHKDNNMGLFQKMRILSKTKASEPYKTALKRLKKEYAYKSVRPLVYFRKHNILILYLIHCLRKISR